MQDLYWQKPHHPGDAVTDWLTGDVYLPENIVWQMDNGSCQADYLDGNGVWHRFYPHAPLIEAEIYQPKFGLAIPQSELPPPLPSGISQVWLDPATHTSGDVSYSPNAIGFNEDATPAAALTEWATRAVLKVSTEYDSTCRFKSDYQEWFGVSGEAVSLGYPMSYGGAAGDDEGAGG
jgi:hypothetical protein